MDIAGVGVVVDGDDETVDTVDGVDVGDVDVVEVDADYVGTSTTTYGRTRTSNATIEISLLTDKLLIQTDPVHTGTIELQST